MGSDLNQLEIDRSNVTGILQQFQSDNSLGFRVRTIVNNNPYMASNMGAVMQMAQSDYSDLDIHRNSGAIYGAITADTLKSQLQNYDESIQRSIFANLTPQQQGALNQQGYEQPKADTSDNDGFFRDALGLIAKPIGMVVRGAGSIPGVTGLTKGGLKVLEEVSNVPGWLYRSAVNQTWEERLIGLAAAGVTVAGFLAAPTTGGTSAAVGVGARAMLLRLLARPALGVTVKGLTAVTAANVAQGASQVLTGNADDWWHTFSDAKNGERFFKIGSVKQAEELLQDSRLTNLATRISMEFDDFSLLNVTKDVAETGQLTAQTMQSIADDMADPGTDENKQLVETLTSLLQNPIFQEAVEILQKGKISLGRSIASTLQFDEDGDMYRYISGSVDAASWFIFDPFMAASKIQKSSKILRLGFANIDSAEEVNLLDRFLVVSKEPEIRRSYEIFAESINTSNVALRNRFVPWLASAEDDFRHFLLAEGKGAATADNFIEWVTGSNQLKMIMQGKGIVHGSKTAVMLKGVTKGQEARKAYVTGPVKDFIDGIQFSDNLRVLSKTPLGKSGVSAVAQVDEMMNSSYIDALPEIEKLRLGNALNPRAFAAGQAVNRFPGAKMFSNLVTDLGTLVAGKSALLDSPEDVKRFVDLFAAGQVPKHVRDLWTTAINGQQGVAAKMNAVEAFYETIFNATGLTSTPKGFEFAEEFLMHSKKVYHVGPLGATDGVPQTVLQNNTAVKIHLPELHEIRKAVDAEVVTRHLLNIVENPWISTAQRKFWKPSVLLRVGFITRNASEDMIGFIARNGIGHLTQEFASRSVVKGVIAESIPAAAKAGATLTPSQLSAVSEKFAIMSWMRPIEHIMSRFQGDVVNHFLVKQTASIRQVLNKGFKGGTLQDHPLAIWAAGIDPRSMTEGFSLTNAQIKANAAMQKLALGGKYSARRMLLGGVDNELYNSSKEFMQTYQKVLMDQIGSSTTMVPYAGQFSNNLQVSISGSFDIIPSSAEGSLEAMVKNMQHHMSDPGFRFVADNHALYLPPEIAQNLTPDQLGALLKNWKALEFDENDSLFDIYTILTERASTHSGVLNTTSPERWQMLVAHLEKRNVQPKLIKKLKIKYQGEKVPTWEDFVLENSGGGGWGRTTISEQQYYDLIQFHNTHIATISDDVTRGHIKANLLLDNTTGGTHLPLEEINAMGMGDNLYGPFSIDKAANDAKFRAKALLEINERTGSFAQLPQLKQFEDKAVGTRVHVIDFADNSNTFLDPDLLIGSLLKTDGSVDISGLANALGLDSTVMSLTQQKNLEGIVQDILDAIMKKDKLILHTPQLRQSSDVTDSIHKYLDEIFQSKFNRKIMKPKSANIPIDDMNQLKTRYPTVGAFKPSVNFGTNGQIKLRTAKWDSVNYPLAGEYLTAATGDIGNEKIIDDLIKLYQDMTQSHVRMSMKTRDKIIYEKVGSQYVAIAPDTELYNLDKKLFFSDAKGKTPLKLGNQSYFEQHVLDYGPNSETLHSFVQPAHYDEIMNSRGTILREPTLGSQKKYWDMNPVTKKVTEREVVVDYTKSITLNESHLAGLPAEYLPNYTIKSLEEAADLGRWDKIVQGGFKYMGASIDAIARRPMAFHAFHQARLRNQKNIEWLFTNTSANIQLGQAIDDAIANKIFSVAQTGQFQKFGDVGRLAGQTQNINGAAQWTNREAFAFLKGFKSSDDDFAALIDGLRANITPGKTAPKQKALINFLEKQSDNLLMTLPTDVTTSEFLLMIDQFLGEGSALLGRATFKGIPRNNLLNQGKSLNVENIVDDIGWDVVQKAAQSKQVVRKNASDYAAEFAINDIMPFIDTHQTRSQFSEHLRGFLPFWYANENFLKRWTLMMTKDGPLGAAVLARKLILTQNGLRTMGIVRKDAQGKDYFVYPGSDLFIDVIGKLPFMGELMSAQAMLQTPTDKLVPGFSTTNFGAPGLTPLVGVSMNVIGGILQEVPVFNDDVLNTYDDIKTAILGDQQQDRKFYEYILPSGVINTWAAMTGYGVGKERIASAAMSAIAHLEATGNGLKDGASAAEADEFIRNVRNHARIIVLSQALAGWFTPGPASGLQTTEDQSSISWLTEGKIENPAELLSAEYYSLISSLGIEEGTQKYLELYKTNTIHDVINPAAYTVSKTETAGKAVMPGTEEARQFYINNKEIIDSYPTAGAWLLPQANEGSKRSKHAYDSEIINGFRNMKTTEAFLNELKFKEASHDYFKAKNNYEIKINELNANGDFSLAKQYSADWDRQSVIYKGSHPIFTQYLETGDARQRRDAILGELRYAFDDPQFPKAAHFDGMKEMLTVFDEFVMQKRRLGLSGSGMSKVMRTELEQSFIAWAENHIKLNPGVETFYNTVIQPEAGL